MWMVCHLFVSDTRLKMDKLKASGEDDESEYYAD